MKQSLKLALITSQRCKIKSNNKEYAHCHTVPNQMWTHFAIGYQKQTTTI